MPADVTCVWIFWAIVVTFAFCRALEAEVAVEDIEDGMVMTYATFTPGASRRVMASRRREVAVRVTLTRLALTFAVAAMPAATASVEFGLLAKAVGLEMPDKVKEPVTRVGPTVTVVVVICMPPVVVICEPPAVVFDDDDAQGQDDRLATISALTFFHWLDVMLEFVAKKAGIAQSAGQAARIAHRVA